MTSSLFFLSTLGDCFELQWRNVEDTPFVEYWIYRIMIISSSLEPTRVSEHLPTPQCCHVFTKARCHTSDTQKEKGRDRQRRHGGLERSIPLGGGGAERSTTMWRHFHGVFLGDFFLSCCVLTILSSITFTVPRALSPDPLNGKKIAKKKMLCFQSNTIYISFRDIGCMFGIN